MFRRIHTSLGLLLLTTVIIYILTKNRSLVSINSKNYIGFESEKTKITIPKVTKGYNANTAEEHSASAQTNRNVRTTPAKVQTTSVSPDGNDVTIPETHKPSFQGKTNNVTIPEVQHVVFLKVHKAGSSTIQNILARFGMSRSLNVMVPPTHNILSESTTLKRGQFVPYSPNGLYDILCCHVIYNKAAMAQYFPSDTKYIGIVREPFHQFVSAFLYYRRMFSLPYLTAIPETNPIATYLENPRKYEPKFPGASFTNNRMSFDFGYPPDQFGNTSYMDVYVEQLVSELDCVIVMEYFDESLLLMKRMLGWTLKDILYIPRNAMKAESFNFTMEDKERHRELGKLDYVLYAKFLGILLKKLEIQSQSFYDEIGTFRSIRLKVSSFCTNTEDESFLVSETHWSDQFTVTKRDCIYMLMGEQSLMSAVREIYNDPH